MTAIQCRREPKRLGWSSEELAHRALCSAAGVGAFERGKTPGSAAVLASLRRALAEAGLDVEAIPADRQEEVEDAACSQ